jgi:hypothetical protein
MGSRQFLRTTKSGADIYLRLESNTYRRVPIPKSQAEPLGKRVDEEFEKDVAKHPEVGKTTETIMVE